MKRRARRPLPAPLPRLQDSYGDPAADPYIDPWLTTWARNNPDHDEATYNQLRDRRRQQAAAILSPAELDRRRRQEAAAAAAVATLSTTQQLEDVLERLADLERYRLDLVEQRDNFTRDLLSDGLSRADVAQLLGITTQALGKRLASA